MTQRTKGIVALFYLAAIFATFGIFNRYMSQNFSSFQVQYLRVFVAIILSFIFFYKDLRFKLFSTLPRREWLILGIRGMLFYALAAVLNIQAFNLTNYSNVSFLQAIPTTALLGLVFLQEKVTKRKIVIMFLAFIGVILLSVKDFSNAFVWGRGEIVALVADVFFSLLYISRKWHSDLLNNKEITFLVFLFGFLALVILSFIFDHALPLKGWTTDYFVVVIIAGVFIAANQFLVNYGFQYVEPFLANNILALESVFALLIGLFFYREMVTLQEFIGGLLILLSVPLINKEETKKT